MERYKFHGVDKRRRSFMNGVTDRRSASRAASSSETWFVLTMMDQS